MSTGNQILSTWDRIMMAIAFAEADDKSTARELLRDVTDEQRLKSRTRKTVEKRPELRV